MGGPTSEHQLGFVGWGGAGPGGGVLGVPRFWLHPRFLYMLKPIPHTLEPDSMVKAAT